MSQTIFVTGGGSGIGRAVVEAALAAGWNVIATDRAPEGLERLRGQAGANARLLCLPLDVADEAAVGAAFDAAEAAFGPVTGLVNSAGIGADVPLLQTDVAMFRRILEVNLIGSFLTTRALVARREGRAGPGASVVHIASVSGLVGNRGRSAYGASKGGVVQMTRVMAVELAPKGVRVNAVAPGPIETPMAAEIHSAAVRESWCRAVPQRRYGTAEEVAQAVLFLADPGRSGYVTGQVLAVDGGFSVAGLLEEAG